MSARGYSEALTDAGLRQQLQLLENSSRLPAKDQQDLKKRLLSSLKNDINVTHPLEKAIAQDQVMKHRSQKRYQKPYTITHNEKSLKPSCALRDAIHYYFYDGTVKRTFDALTLTLMADFYKLMSSKLDYERPVYAKKFAINMSHDLRKHARNTAVSEHILR